MREPINAAWLRVSGRAPQLALLREMRISQRLSQRAIQEICQRRVIDLLLFSYAHVPYYGRMMAALKLGPRDIEGRPFEVLKELPRLDKCALRESFAELQSRDLSSRKWHVNTSGGSTGEPARFVQDASYNHAGMAGKTLFDEWSGYSPGQPRVVLWGSERELLVGRETWRSRIGDWLRNDHRLNTFRMRDDDMRGFLTVINRVKPTQIVAYVEGAYELARFVERNQLTVYSPRAVLTSAGTLYPYMREMIERVFQAPVFNRYGSREVGDVACDCERHQGLHVNPLTHCVEILREDGTPCDVGEVGRVVITLLTNYAMPLIRYEVGDLAAWSQEECDCGRPWPVLREVAGRTNSVIRTSKGAYASAALSSLFYFCDTEKKVPFRSFGRYQLVQKAIDHVIFRVVVDDQRAWRIEEPIILNKLAAIFGEAARLEIDSVAEIPANPSGKFIYIWSELQ